MFKVLIGKASKTRGHATIVEILDTGLVYAIYQTKSIKLTFSMIEPEQRLVQDIWYAVKYTSSEGKLVEKSTQEDCSPVVRLSSF